ncbi:hypothetical protein [Rathayibacter sp. PhB151]|uniref:hypothetical protein n=1 Tax=Rathayibacter sp. PhB151 TaxID=2485189 RepID=UPI0010638062|nr:hypothetical protein [Rathayibacter sp. PhB151]
MIVRSGPPTTTDKLTVADLLIDRQDGSLVAGVLADAVRRSAADLGLLETLLGVVAASHRHPRNASASLLQHLLKLRDVDAPASSFACAGVRSCGKATPEKR